MDIFTTLHAPLLGALVVEEVLVYEDLPRIFTVRDTGGQCFIAMTVDKDVIGQDYLFTLISEQRLALVQAGEFDARRAFAQGETRTVYMVHIPWQGVAAATIINLRKQPTENDIHDGHRE